VDRARIDVGSGAGGSQGGNEGADFPRVEPAQLHAMDDRVAGQVGEEHAQVISQIRRRVPRGRDHQERRSTSRADKMANGVAGGAGRPVQVLEH
jgi:hypothetical protein